MSRLKKLTHALISGYVQIGVAALYTLASIPLALHYLSPQQFGLWQVATTISGYLLLIDFGITGSAARILIDHKDDPAGGAYGSVIQISIVVFLIQGLAIAVVGTVLSFWLPQLINLNHQFSDPADAWAASRALVFLTAGQCILQGCFFVTRIFWNLAAAHQRYDLYNYAQVGTVIVNFAALWLAFQEHRGIYSVLIASGAGLLFAFCCGWILAVRFHFLPSRGNWGHFDAKLFKEIFFFGGNSFLMAVGFQLINASQILIVSHALGLGAAAVWAVAIKPFLFGQQLVGRMLDFSLGALSEMLVRGERERLLRRFRDIVILSADVGILIFGCIALCNESFIHLWTRGKLAWNPANDFLLALWFLVVAVTRCNINLTGITKIIGNMRYIYFFEGVTFVIVAIYATRSFGIPGMLITAIAADLLWSGIYGTRRTNQFFKISDGEILKNWLARPAIYLVAFALVLIAGHFLIAPLTPKVRLPIAVLISGVTGITLLWLLALNGELRKEMKTIFSRSRKKLANYFGL